jgi:hypothetical protein
VIILVCRYGNIPYTSVISHHIHTLTSLREQAKQFRIQKEDNDDSDISDSEILDGDDDTSVSTPDLGLQHHSLDNIDFYTKCLMDLLPSMEQAYKHLCDPGSRLEEKNGKIVFHVTDAARPYVLHIHDKFRSADMSLVERLGEANWQRFVRVRHQMESKPQDDESKDLRTGARSEFLPLSKFHDSALGKSLRTDSSFAPTVASHSSFISSIAEKDGSRVRVPPTPKEIMEGLPFECFICKRLLNNLKTRVDWKYVKFKP